MHYYLRLIGQISSVIPDLQRRHCDRSAIRLILISGFVIRLTRAAFANNVTY